MKTKDPNTLFLKKCQVCKEEYAVHIWQPELGDKNTLVFYRPGFHIRGFIAIHLGEQCKAKLEQGKTITFTYKKQQYLANPKEIRPIDKTSLCDYLDGMTITRSPEELQWIAEQQNSMSFQEAHDYLFALGYEVDPLHTIGLWSIKALSWQNDVTMNKQQIIAHATQLQEQRGDTL